LLPLPYPLPHQKKKKIPFELNGVHSRVSSTPYYLDSQSFFFVRSKTKEQTKSLKMQGGFRVPDKAWEDV